MDIWYVGILPQHYTVSTQTEVPVIWKMCVARYQKSLFMY